MPIIHFYLIEGRSTPEQEEQLMKRASHFYAEVLECPIDRVRAFIQTYPAARCAVAGELVSSGRSQAPYFEFLAMDGRPLDQRQRLLTGFTDMIVEILGVERGLVRGHCKRVLPEEWCIGGVMAADLRKADIKAFTSKSAAS